MIYYIVKISTPNPKMKSGIEIAYVRGNILVDDIGFADCFKFKDRAEEEMAKHLARLKRQYPTAKCSGELIEQEFEQ